MEMKKVYYLLSIFAIFIPGLVLAITAPSSLTLKVEPVSTQPNGYSVKLNWTNQGSYSALQITRQDPNGNIGIPPTNISNTATSYTDANQNQPWLPANAGKYIYTVQASQGTDTAATQGSVSMPFVDSQIITVTTKAATPPPVPSNTYTLSCAPLANAVYVSWMANVVNPATGTLYIGPNSIDFSQYSATVINNSGSTTINASNLEGSNNYFVIQDANSNNLSNTVGPCGPLSSISSDAPSQLSVFTNGPTTLYLNWKDNSTSTATSTFEVQRFQVTPATPINLQITSSSNGLILSWTNASVNSAPFYTLIERSTSVDFTANLTSSTVSSTATSYEDTTAQTGNTYYYRISNVSQIPVQFYYQHPSSMNNMSVTKPLLPASGYATGSITYVGYNSSAEPMRFLSQLLNNFTAWFLKVPNVKAQTENVINYDNYFKTIATTTAPVLIDQNLNPGTVYMYRVRLVKGSVSTWSNMVAGVTLPAGSQNSGTLAPICTAYGYCNHNINGYYSPDGQASEIQCKVNADCRNVGRASQQTQEQ